MERSARKWASVLLSFGAGTPERIGVLASRSAVGYIGNLAALFSGAAFVPLNARFPVERTRRMVECGQLDAIIVDSASAAVLAEALDGIENPPHILAPENGTSANWPSGIRCYGPSDIESSETGIELPPAQRDDIAYLMFTSGSTGDPKGVTVCHGNVLHFIDVMMDRYRFERNDRFSQTFDLTFDLSVFDMFLAWEAGACLYVPQDVDLLAPAKFVANHDITVWFSVPSIPALMRKAGLLNPDTLPSLRWSLFCGEPLPCHTAEEWQAAAPNSVVENLYGPTELTIACFVYRWNGNETKGACHNEIVSIGRPFPGLGAIVMNDDLSIRDDGGEGELWVCGPQTVPGYWQNSDATASRFVEFDLTPTRKKRFYRTGDRVRKTPDGTYHYLGRVDHQVKVRGWRVELGEIEAVLLEERSIVAAAAIPWPVEDGSAQGVVAFVIGNGPEPQQLRDRAAVKLPQYMVPSIVHFLDEFPLNSNGKTDRKKLASIAAALP